LKEYCEGTEGARVRASSVILTKRLEIIRILGIEEAPSAEAEGFDTNGGLKVNDATVREITPS
jgi:hypothetical protein